LTAALRRENNDEKAHRALKPPDFMPVDLADQLVPSTVIDANELLWAARILASLVRVHRNVIPDMREKVKVARAILESYAEVRDFDPRDQRWTVSLVRIQLEAVAARRTFGRWKQAKSKARACSKTSR